jgi:phenylacetate-CoA ligase
MFLNPAIEQLTRAQLTKLQTTRLKAMLTRLYEKSLFYETRMNEAGLHPADIRDLSDIKELPFTTIDDLRQNYPYGFLTMPVSGVTRFQAQEGLALGYTGQDIYQQIETIARSLVALNIVSGSIMLALSASPACRAVQQAAEGIGITVLDSTFSKPMALFAALTDFGVTQLCSSQQDLAQFCTILEKNPALKADLLIKSWLLCSEQYPLPPAYTKQLGVPVYALYGESFIAPAGLAGECHCQSGLHVYEDSFYVEIIDKATAQPVPPGQSGELVVTTLTREAAPLVRVRTGKSAVLDTTPCSCGRSSVRITHLK